MDDSEASRPGWEMVLGFPSCTCATKPEQQCEDLVPDASHACSLHVKKSPDENNIHINLGPATSGGGEAANPQCVRTPPSGPVSIVIRPSPRSAHCGPNFTDERAASDRGMLSPTNSCASSRRRTARSSGQASPIRHSRSSSTDGRRRQACPPGSATRSRASAVEDRSPTDRARRTDMCNSPLANGGMTNRIRFDKHTISSLISSRIGDLNREAKLLQQMDCKRKEDHWSQHWRKY